MQRVEGDQQMGFYFPQREMIRAAKQTKYGDEKDLLRVKNTICWNEKDLISNKDVLKNS